MIAGGKRTSTVNLDAIKSGLDGQLCRLGVVLHIALDLVDGQGLGLGLAIERDVTGRHDSDTAFAVLGPSESPELNHNFGALGVHPVGDVPPLCNVFLSEQPGRANHASSLRRGVRRLGGQLRGHHHALSRPTSVMIKPPSEARCS